MVELVGFFFWKNYWDNEWLVIHQHKFAFLGPHSKMSSKIFSLYWDSEPAEISGMWGPLFLHLESCASDTVSLSFCCLYLSHSSFWLRRFVDSICFYVAFPFRSCCHLLYFALISFNFHVFFSYYFCHKIWVQEALVPAYQVHDRYRVLFIRTVDD